MLMGPSKLAIHLYFILFFLIGKENFINKKTPKKRFNVYNTYTPTAKKAKKEEKHPAGQENNLNKSSTNQ